MNPIRAAVLAGLVAAVSARAEDALPRPRGIVLITIDTLRADHCSALGHGRPTTPFLDSLAADGVLFRQAYAASSWTAPSMASLFTGLYPREHGVRHGAVTRGSEPDIAGQEVLAERFVTIAEALKEQGYRTFGVSCNGHMTRDTGFAQGFDFFESNWFEECPAPNVAVELWRDEIETSGRFFLWVHYFDPHVPYTARSPWIEQYGTPRERADEWGGTQLEDLHLRIREIRKDPAAAAALRDLYDSEIARCDSFVEQLFRSIRIDERDLVIVTSDHGEEFLEHRGLGHGDTLYEEVVRVPLIVRFPGGRFGGTTIDAPVENRNVAATVADILGGPAVAGTSLFPLIRGEESAADAVFLELDRGMSLTAVRRDGWKLISPARELAGGNTSKMRLYDLAADPRETTDLSGERAGTAAELSELLRRWQEGTGAGVEAPVSPRPLTPEQKTNLKSLGYGR